MLQVQQRQGVGQAVVQRTVGKGGWLHRQRVGPQAVCVCVWGGGGASASMWLATLTEQRGWGSAVAAERKAGCEMKEHCYSAGSGEGRVF